MEGAAYEAVHGKKKCVTEIGCDAYRTSLCESFSMCDHVAFKAWNVKTKRWEL